MSCREAALYDKAEKRKAREQRREAKQRLEEQQQAAKTRSRSTRGKKVDKNKQKQEDAMADIAARQRKAKKTSQVYAMVPRL